MLTDKKLQNILIETSKIANPFGINDICLYFNLPRNHDGKEILDCEYGINAKMIGKFVQRSMVFRRSDTKSSSHVRWEYVGDKD